MGTRTKQLYDVVVYEIATRKISAVVGGNLKETGDYHLVESRLEVVLPRLNEQYDAIEVEAGKYKKGECCQMKSKLEKRQLSPVVTAASLSCVGSVQTGEVFVKRLETRLVVREVVSVKNGRVRFVEGRSLHGRRAAERSVDLPRWQNWAADATRLKGVPSSR